jgi:hypothetical protein
MSTTEAELAAHAHAHAGEATPETHPYAPSWLNLLLDWIERLPGPSLLAYAVLALIAVLGGHFALWNSGLLPVGQLDAGQTFWGIYLPAQLWIIHELDGVARSSFEAFRPAADFDDATAARHRYELTVTPAIPAAVIALVMVPATFGYYALDPVSSQVVGYSVPALLARATAESFVGAVLMVFVYHTVRQLRLVSRLHAAATRVDLFQPRPLYAFSRLTSRTGIALLALTVSGLLANPPQVSSAAFWAIWAPWIVGVPAVAVLIFVLPMLGMHRRLATAKEEAQTDADERLRAIMAELDRAVDARDLPRAEGLQKMLAANLSQRDVLARLRTWPWSTGTLRGFASTLLLPIVIFLIQQTLIELLRS